MNTQTITGTYGSNETETEIYTYTDADDVTWYVCHDSVNVNGTLESVEEGANVELIEDCDTSTAQEPICSEEDLERHMSDDDELGFEYVIESWINGQKKQAILHIDNCGDLHSFMEWAEASQDEEAQERIFAIIKNYALYHGL